MNPVKKFGVILLAIILAVTVISPVLSQGAKSDEEKAALKHKTEMEKLSIEMHKYQAPLNSPGWGAGIGAGLVILGAGLGFGKIGSSALESMARQPETAGRVQTAMIIIGALLEGATFFALIICIQLAGKA